MSELRIALVAEGPTDAIIIEAALKGTLRDPFTLSLLQPEPTRPAMGGGWGGVFKWCRELATHQYAYLADDPRLEQFDLVVLHLDADVADKSYADGGPEMALAASTLLPLPCSMPCPPPEDTVDELRRRLLSWLGVSSVGPKAVLCIPSKATEAWLAAGVLARVHPAHAALECNRNTEGLLSSRPKGLRIKKSRRAYLDHQGEVASAWNHVRMICGQADRFSREVLQAIP